MDHHRPVELLGEDRLLVAAHVVAPLDGVAGFLNILNGVGIGDARERLLHLPQRARIPLEDGGQVLLVLLQYPPDDLHQEVFGEIHVALEVHPGHLRLHHPELGEVSPGLALFRPEGGPEDVGLADGHRRRLAVELAALGEKRLPQVEVRHLEERGGSFAGRRCEDGRIDEGESTLVEVVPDGLDERVPHRQDRALPGAAQPQVPLLLEEADAVLLRLDGVAGLALPQAEVLHVDLESDR